MKTMYRIGFIALALSLLALPSHVLARAIYIQDMIVLDLEGPTITRQAIEESFDAFEIEGIEEKGQGYQVRLRPKAPGHYQVTLGGRSLEIEVASTLEDIGRDQVFDQELTWQSSHSFWLLLVLSLLSGGVCLGASAVLMKQWLSKRVKPNKQGMDQPYQRALSQLEMALKDPVTSMSQMSLALKAFMTSCLPGQESLMAKTAKEIEGYCQERLSHEQWQECQALTQVLVWLKEVEALAYSPSTISLETKEQYGQKALDLVKRLHEEGGLVYEI